MDEVQKYLKKNEFEIVPNSLDVRCVKCRKRYRHNQWLRMANHHWDHQRLQRQANYYNRKHRIEVGT